MSDNERAGIVTAVTQDVTKTLRTLDPNLLALVILVAMTMGVLAYSTVEQRNYQHAEVLALVQACLVPRGQIPFRPGAGSGGAYP